MKLKTQTESTKENLCVDTANSKDEHEDTEDDKLEKEGLNVLAEYFAHKEKRRNREMEK